MDAFWIISENRGDDCKLVAIYSLKSTIARMIDELEFPS
jgi:hypothetical protein